MEDYCVELAAKLGSSFTQDPQICRSYNHDLGEMSAVLLGLFKRTPGAVALPRTAQQVSDCLSVAHKHRVPVTVRAQASSGYGGTMPTVGGLLVDVSRMNKVISVDEEHRTCDVEPGVVWKDLNEELSRHGLASRICPTSGPSSTVGGMFAMGGVGIGSYRYGSILDCVEEIDVVDPDGTMRTVKGHELSVYAFSQGTLGIITRLRLLLRKDVELSKLAFQLASADQVDQVIQLLSLLHPYSISVLSAPYLIMQAENAKKPGQPPITSGFLMLAVFEEKPDEATVQKITGAAHIKLLEQAVADEEWEERFYPMRLKRGGPSLLCGEYVVPRSLFGPCWKKITGRMPRDIVGLEAFADNQNQMSTLVYVLDSSEDFSLPLPYGQSHDSPARRPPLWRLRLRIGPLVQQPVTFHSRFGTLAVSQGAQEGARPAESSQYRQMLRHRPAPSAFLPSFLGYLAGYRAYCPCERVS